MLLDLIAGARPNFVKLAPIIRAVEEARTSGADVFYRFIHTGQHSSDEMSAAMMRDLRMPAPDIELRCAGVTRGAMLSSVIKAYDKILHEQKPHWTVVVGDVTSTLGAALAAKSADVRVAHVEAGLRSGDRTMPEELNRVATDAVADLLFTTSRTAGENLLREGVSAERIRFVGNVMADSLLQTIPMLQCGYVLDKLGVSPGDYCLLTLHRPANVDDPTILHQWLVAVAEACSGMPVLFPVHPRTRRVLQKAGFSSPDFRVVAPLSYTDFLSAQQHAAVIITDSGGVSEEATVLRKPCVALRTSTERPETVTNGTNVLAPKPADVPNSLQEARSKISESIPLPELWDGRTSQRIVNALLQL